LILEMSDPVEQPPVAAVAEQPVERTADEAAADEAAADEAAADEAAAEETAPEEDVKSRRVTLADLCAKGTALYAHKNYEEAANHYGRAADLQAEINGEMDPENAEILFLYGRSMFKVGQSKSDVLGGAATEKKDKKPAKGGAELKEEGEQGPEGKAMFQFEGDDNIEEAAEEEAAEGAEDEAEEDDDDELTIAFEVLDLAKVLFQRRLEDVEAGEKGKGADAAAENPTMRHVQERLGDCHDLLAELSLEQER
jgi:HAT1-interacting factor 1